MSISFAGSEPRCARGRWHHRHLVLAALVVPVGLVCLAYLDLGSVSFAAVVIFGQVGVRKTYRLDVDVYPKINAFLILEKARTGMTIAEVVEMIFQEYQKQRNNGGS